MAMSMRPRGAAAAARRSRTGVRPVYEDFKPTSEWMHEEGVDILVYHLPGFVKEQIRIIAESTGILRVHGERLIANNKWSRFQEDIVVPEGCNLNEIRAKFEDGILRITMPNNKKMESKKHIIEKETNKTDEPSSSSVTQSSVHQKPQLSKEDLSLSSTPPTYTEKTQKTSNYPQPVISPKSVDELPPKKLYDTTNIESKEVAQEGISTSLNKNTNETKRGHEGDDLNVKEKHKMNANYDYQEKNSVRNFSDGYGFSNLKNLTKSHVTRRLDEDRHLLMNMGAAILVIMALGASISYSLGSSNQFN